jgi:DNA-binding MltR family transcriptional regulator
MSTSAEKKRVRAGHRGSATKAIGRAETKLTAGTPDLDKLSQLKLSLEEKLETLKISDTEILGMVDDRDMVEEIEQADEFKEGMYAVLVKIERSNPATGPAPQ